MNQRTAENNPVPAADGSNNCCWMDAGVIDYKLCDREFDCEHCPFDEVIHGRAASNRSDFHANARMADTVSIRGFTLGFPLFYHAAHTWGRIEQGGSIRAGLDDFGQRILGRVFSVSLPLPGTAVRCGEECWFATHKTGMVALASPVSGRISEINEKLLQYPALLNRDPYGEGWALLIEPADLKESLKDLRYGEHAAGWYECEIEKLYSMLIGFSGGEQTALAATLPDGGVLTTEFISGLTAAQIGLLTREFFGSQRHVPLKPSAARPAKGR